MLNKSMREIFITNWKTLIREYKDDSTSTPASLQTGTICYKVSFPSFLFIRKVLTVTKAPVLFLCKKVDHHNCISAQRVAASLNWRSAETTGKRLDFSLACEWMGLFKLQQQEALKQKTFNIVYCALDEELWCGILLITVQSHFTVCWSCKITRDCMWLVGHCLQPQDGWL